MKLDRSLKRISLIIFGVAFAMTLLNGQVTIDPPSRSFTKDGGAGAILTLGSGSWTATTPDNWITITPRTSGTVGESCIYVVASNFSADTRTGEIDINGNTHTVSQFGYPATLTPNSANADLDGGGGSISISAAAGVSWTATSNSNWIAVSPASGLSSGSVTYTVEPNPGVSIRNGSLTIAGQTFTVTQTGTDVNLSPREVEKAYSSDIIQLQVTALVGTNWTVTLNNPWISVVDDGNGFGDSQITLAVSTNPSFQSRTGTVSIGSATLTVEQAGTPNPVLDIVPDQATADPVGAYGNAAILATPDAPWTAESEVPWIIIADGESGAGNGNIQYVVSANPDLQERTGRIKVAPPFYTSNVDLSLQLLCHIKSDSQDRSGWNRDLTGSLATTFDGTTPLSLQGQDFYRHDDAFSLALWFNIQESDSINRLFQALRAASSYTALYVDAQNRLVFAAGAESLVTSLLVEPGTDYQVLVAVDASGNATVYAGRRDGMIAEVGTRSFAESPFPSNYLTPARIQLGSSNLPTTGNLTNASLDDLRLYGRDLNAAEAEALFSFAGTATPYGHFTHIGDSENVVVEYNFQGQGLVAGGTYKLANSALLLGTVSSYSVTSSSVVTVSARSYTEVWSQDVASLVPGCTVRAGTGSWDSGSSNTTSFYVRYRYFDGTYTDSAVYSAAYPLAHVDFVIPNPSQEKEIQKIQVFAKKTSYYSFVNGSIQINFPVYQRSEENNNLILGGRYDNDSHALSGQANIQIADHQSSFAAASATYNLWLRLDSLSQNATLFRRSSYGTNLLQFDYSTSQSAFTFYLSGPGHKDFPVSLEAGQWYMLTIASEFGSTTKLYLNGEEIGNTNIYKDYRFGSDPQMQELLIGGWDGAIDYASFYDGALSSPQVKAIYDAQKFDYQYHTVTQGTVTPTISPTSSAFAASGGSGSVVLIIAGNVNWSASASAPWLSLTSASSGIGATTTTFDIAANTSVYERQGTLTLAGETVQITQAGLSASLDHNELVFGTDGGSDWIDVFPEANGSWEAVSNASWLTIAIGASGTGPGSVLLVADPYSQTSQSRTGTIEVAGETIYVTQRGYQLSVSPEIALVGSNSGAGEFGVAAPISAVWEAITTQPWITINGSTTGVGNGTLRYTLATNTTGETRTGRIIVSGTEYTITQQSSLQVAATAGTGGSVNGGGGYETNATAVLTATAETGYAFSHWTGDAVGSANPLNLSVDSDKEVTAHFIPVDAASAFQAAGENAVLADPNAYNLYEENQLRAMAVGRPFLSVDSSTYTLTVGFGIKESEDLSNWGSVNIQSSQTFIRDGKIEVDLTVDADAKFYQIFTE